LFIFLDCFFAVRFNTQAAEQLKTFDSLSSIDSSLPTWCLNAIKSCTTKRLYNEAETMAKAKVSLFLREPCLQAALSQGLL
jgi:hypothetical protein